MKVILPRSAQKDLDTIEDKTAFKISQKIRLLADNPFPNGSRKLSGDEGYRMRIGNYRVIYTIDKKNEVIRITKVAHRREVYK